MTIVPIVPKAIARFGSSRARTAWKACGQSLPALFAGVLFRAGIDHILSTLSARRRTANVPALRRSDKYGLRGCGPAWPRRQSATAGSAPVRSAEKRSHASGLDRGASNAKPGLDMPGRNCRTIGTQLDVPRAVRQQPLLGRGVRRGRACGGAGLRGADRDPARGPEGGRARARVRPRKDRCDPLHCLPALRRKPGALRNGAPFKGWDLPEALREVRRRLEGRPGGDRKMVDILLAIRTDGIDAVEAACADALSQGVHSSSVILNILARRREPPRPEPIAAPDALRLACEPAADCNRYDSLRRHAHDLIATA